MTEPEGGAPTLVPDDHPPGETIRFDDEGAPVPEVAAAPLDQALSLGEVLGTGGMAVVREAHQRVLGRSVAVKSAKGKANAAARLVAEARITGALEHPGILPVHDILQDADGLPHIVLKRVEGRSWADWMDDPDAVAREFGATDTLGWHLEVLDAVCNAVHFAHVHGVIHRDLKPENVMVGSFGQVYVLDWGIAVSLREDARFPLASEQNRVVGTPRYMAPEMVGGLGSAVGPFTDVYLLGAILFRILSGHPPHKGFGVQAILARIPRFVPALPDAPTELASLVADAMHLDPDHRPESAEVFRRRIRAFLDHRGAAAIAEAADRRVTELLALLEDPDADRIRVYDLFGAIRFGLQEALTVWPEHEGARRGLERASLALADWELAHGDDRAAEVLLGMLDQVPAHVSARLQSVREVRQSNLDRLERLALDRNPRVGQRVRASLAAVFTVLWTVSSLYGVGRVGASAVWLGLAWIAVAGIAVVRYREKWFATRMNRAVAVLLGAALYGQVLLGVGQVSGAMGTQQAGVAMWLLLTVVCLISSFQLHRGFALPALYFGVAFVFAHELEPWRPMFAACGNFLVGAVGVVMWWPREARVKS